MLPTLNFASQALLAVLLAIVVLFVYVIVRAVRKISDNARRESGGETALLSMALQDALT
jgi:hypothetical protein